MKINGSCRSESDKKRRRDYMCNEYKRRCLQVMKRVIANEHAEDTGGRITGVSFSTSVSTTLLSSIKSKGTIVRHRNRCVFTGRPRGVYSYFKASRSTVLELFNNGFLPGLRKS